LVRAFVTTCSTPSPARRRREHVAQVADRRRAFAREDADLDDRHWVFFGQSAEFFDAVEFHRAEMIGLSTAS